MASIGDYEMICCRGEVEDTWLEAKAKDSPSEDRASRGQEPRIQAQVFSKKKGLQNNFIRRFPIKKVFQIFFQVIYKIWTI